MKASNFKRFKKSLRKHIYDFSVGADKNVNKDEVEMPIHRYSAAEILVWIIENTGITLRKHQLVEAWKAIVSKCWNMIDFDLFCANNDVILRAVEWVIKKGSPKFN